MSGSPGVPSQTPMNIYMAEGSKYVEVALSKRNLDTLVGLYELAMQGEAIPAIVRLTEDGTQVRVVVQPDSVHYGDRQPGDGPVIRKALGR